MIVGIEFLVVALLMLVFSNGGVFSLVYALMCVGCAIGYYLAYLKEIKPLPKEEKEKYKESISYKLIIVAVMIVTINLIYPLGNVNLVIGYFMLIYFIGVFVNGVIRKKILDKGHLMNFNFLFDIYSIVCLICMVKEMLTYAF